MKSRFENTKRLRDACRADAFTIDKTNGCIQGGFNEENDPIYIGRAHHEDSYAVGKVALKFVRPIFYFKLLLLNLMSPLFNL